MVGFGADGDGATEPLNSSSTWRSPRLKSKSRPPEAKPLKRCIVAPSVFSNSGASASPPVAAL